jgi:hypothetical protein
MLNDTKSHSVPATTSHGHVESYSSAASFSNFFGYVAASLGGGLYIANIPGVNGNFGLIFSGTDTGLGSVIIQKVLETSATAAAVGIATKFVTYAIAKGIGRIITREPS